MIKIKDRNIVPIPGNPHMLRLAILTKGIFREFWVMLCIAGEHKGKCYIEEYVSTMTLYSEDIYGNFKFIEEDKLAEDLTRFSELHKLTDIAERASEMSECGLGHVVFN